MKWMRWGLLMSMLSIAGGCAATTGDFCDVSAPIRPSPGDVASIETQRQIVAHNRTGAKLCGWRP